MISNGSGLLVLTVCECEEIDSSSEGIEGIIRISLDLRVLVNSILLSEIDNSGKELIDIR
jgi:hypothetical protein